MPQTLERTRGPVNGSAALGSSMNSPGVNTHLVIVPYN